MGAENPSSTPELVAVIHMILMMQTSHTNDNAVNDIYIAWVDVNICRFCTYQ